MKPLMKLHTTKTLVVLCSGNFSNFLKFG